MPIYKKRGEDPGGTARYFAEGGLGRYTYIWCGGCQHTEQPCNTLEAKQNGWRKRRVWGWLCADCLKRLNLLPKPKLAA